MTKPSNGCSPNGVNEACLPELERAVRKILGRRGVPENHVSNFRTTAAVCVLHALCIRVDVRFGGVTTVKLTHCGCDSLKETTKALPTTVGEMALDLAAEIIWHRDANDEILAHISEIRAASQAEAAKSTAAGMDATHVGIGLSEFKTYYGRHQGFDTHIDLIGPGVAPHRWVQSFSRPEDVARFYKSDRLYTRALAKQRDALAALGANCAIDLLNLWALEEVGLKPLEAMAEFAKTGRMEVSLSGFRLIFSWRVKTMRGAFFFAGNSHWEIGAFARLENESCFKNEFGVRKLRDILPTALFDIGRDEGRFMYRPVLLEDGVAKWVGADTCHLPYR